MADIPSQETRTTWNNIKTGAPETYRRTPETEIEATGDEIPTVSWRSILSGVVVSLLAYSMLLALGLAIGGANLQGAIQGPDTMRGLGIGTAIWLVISTAASLFAGGYVASRSRPYVSKKLGGVQGLVVSGVVLLILLTEFGSGVAALGSGIGKTLGFAGAAGGAAAQNSQVQQIIEDAVGGGGNLRAPVDTVAQGVATRLLRGDTESATNYFAAQTGMSRAEAQGRINEISQRVTKTASDAGVVAAKTLRYTGWAIFTMLLFGTIAGYMGGRMVNRHEEDFRDRHMVH